MAVEDEVHAGLVEELLHGQAHALNLLQSDPRLDKGKGDSAKRLLACAL